MRKPNQWVVQTNIADFKRKLASERDAGKRRILEELLAKEELKLGAAAKTEAK